MSKVLSREFGAARLAPEEQLVLPNGSAGVCGDLCLQPRTISAAVATYPEPRTPEEYYLDLIKRCLTRTLVAKGTERHTISPGRPHVRLAYGVVRSILAPFRLELVRTTSSRPEDYLESGHAAENRVEDAETMLGTRQLDHMQSCISDVLRNGIPGDLLEAGVWRAGMTIFMRAVLKAFGNTEKRVWVADSFEGLPPSDTTTDSFGWRAGDMAVSLKEAQQNFSRYGLFDGQVVFLKGFFNQTLDRAPLARLAILRVDADLYSSTLDVLNALYQKLSPGGYAIFDDYQNLPDCRKAIDQYRAEHGITEELKKIDTRSVYWQKA
jgi:O-methyltransferase